MWQIFLIVLLTTKLLYVLYYLAQIHILVRFKDRKRKIEICQKEFCAFIYESVKFLFSEQLLISGIK